VVPGIRNIAIRDEVSTCNSADQINVWNNMQPSNSTTMKEEKVGSLSFNVISTIPPRARSESSTEAAQDAAGDCVKDPVERKAAVRKPVARAKVPFEKGYSQMDWLKLTRTHPDLAGTLNFSSLHPMILPSFSLLWCLCFKRYNLVHLLHGQRLHNPGLTNTHESCTRNPSPLKEGR